EQLSTFGESAVPLLAHFVGSAELGTVAVEAMLSINRDRAAPFLFASMPGSGRGVEYRTFRHFVQLLLNGEKVCCLDALHDAAVRVVESPNPTDATEMALYAIGLSGSEADFPLLKRAYVKAEPADFWADRLRRAGSASLARLGDATHVAL